MLSIYFTWYQIIVTFILPSVVMISCYSSVIHSLRTATNNMVVMTNRCLYLVRQYIYRVTNLLLALSDSDRAPPQPRLG